MRVFIFTTCFAPSIGGIERLTELLATQFVELGHEVTLATLTPGGDRGPWSFPVVRQPSTREFMSMLKWCDVHLQANLSLWHLHPLLTRKVHVVAHGTEYSRDTGKRGLRDYLKLWLVRRVHGVAASRYIAHKVHCRSIIGNPYDNAIFRTTTPWSRRALDLVFLGRLTSEKGLPTLVQALALLREQGRTLSCTIIGDGPERHRIGELAATAGLSDHVRLTGALRGKAIAEELNRNRIMVVPSTYAEPFGIVALEGLACGCLPIVSERGGLVDAIGPHGLTFRNGDAQQLAERIEMVLREPALAGQLLEGADQHLAQFTARRVAGRYLDLFDQLLSRAA